MDIAVYCGWRPSLSRMTRLARSVGETLAEAGHTVVFGGGELGSMGEMAIAAHQAGGRVVAVTTPEWVTDIDKTWSELIVVDSLHDRKSAMDNRVDAALVLPGSIGTLAEMTATMEHFRGEKPVVVVDPWGHYEGLLAWLPGILPVGYMPLLARNAVEAVAMAEGLIPVQ